MDQTDWTSVIYKGGAPSVQSLNEEIKALPTTWLPALFIAICEQCVERKVFREGGMEALLKKIVAKGAK